MNRIKVFLPILISAFFIYLAVCNLSLHQIIQSFSTIKWGWIGLSFLFTVFGFIVRVIRWRFFFLNSPSYYSLTSSFLIGLTVNNLLPARIGELVRAYILKKREDVSVSLAFGTILLERVFDGLSVFLFLAILLFVCPFPSKVKTMGFIITGIYLLTLIFFILLKTHKDFVLKKMAFSQKLALVVSEFAGGLSILGSFRQVLIISVYSIIAWVIYGFCLYFCLFGFSLNLPIYVGFFVLVMAVIGVMIPAAPGYLGTYQYFCILALALFNVPQNIAFSYSMVAYIISFVPVTIFGIVFLFLEGLSFEKLLSLKDDKIHP
ncbi:MAG: lysylphosphatidylglycerol synthase transmembrane domain-containing protein [bacterium]